MSRNIFNAHKNDDDKIGRAKNAGCPQDRYEKCDVCEQIVLDAGPRGCR